MEAWEAVVDVVGEAEMTATAAVAREVASVPVEPAAPVQDRGPRGRSWTIAGGFLGRVRHLRGLAVLVGEMPCPRDSSRAVWER